MTLTDEFVPVFDAHPMKYILVLFLPLALIASGCDFAAVRDAVDDFDLIIQLEPIETFAVGQIMDAETGELIDDAVSLRMTGKDASAVVDIYSDPITSTTIRGGMVTLGIGGSLPLETGAPAEIGVIASSERYEEGYVELRITETGEHAFDLFLVPSDREVEGVRRTGAQFWLNEGRTAAFHLNTGTGDGGASAQLSVPGRIEVLDANGNPLNGTLATQLSHYGASSLPGMRAFPGSFRSLQFQEDGASANTFVPAGTIHLEAHSSAGQRADRFGSDVELIIELEPDAVNPRTGAVYQPGDELSVLHFDRTTRKWIQMGNVALENAAGKAATTLSARYETQRTGYQAIGAVVPLCERGVEIDLHRNGHAGALQGVVRASGGGFYRSIVVPAGENSITIPNLPDGVSLELDIVLPTGFTLTQSLQSSCGGRETVELLQSDALPTTVTFGVFLSCTLKLQPPFNATLNYKKAGVPGGGVSAGVPEWYTDSQRRVIGGELIIDGMYIDETYRFILVTPGQSRWADVTITSEQMIYNVDIPEGLCRR